MDARALRRSLAAAAIAAAPLAHASTQAPACQLPGDEANPLADRAGLLAQYERVPHACLQDLFKACNDASSKSLLDFGSAAVCSFAYEALLSQRFNGSFRELMAWWRTQRAGEAQ
jgi:hypothetical protein